VTRDDRPLGNVANKLLFENELVRVWEMDLAPGDAPTATATMFRICYACWRARAVDADVEGAGRVELPVQPGSVFFVPPGATRRRSTRPASASARS